MDVRLTEIDYEHFHEVIDLELEEDQEEYLPSNVYSLAEAGFSRSFFPRAIWLQEDIVGFLMYQINESATARYPCTIWRFMIDRRYQNRGIGKAAMSLLIEELKTEQRCASVEIFYDDSNAAASRLYTQYGFTIVGHRDDGDVIAAMTL